jgi:hypothetical protein
VSTALAVAALVYLAAYGARMPVLAFRGLLRLRNLILILGPSVVLSAIAFALEGRVDDRVAAGAFAVALAPAPLVGPGVVARLRGRMDLAGVLGLGTILLTFVLVSARGPLATGGLFIGTQAYAIAATVGAVIPRLRDALLLPLRIAGWAAFAVVLAAGALAAPAIDLATVVVALGLLLAGIAASLAAAYETGREPLAAVVGAGLRDPALAVALATAAGGTEATGVPLIYAVFCLGLAGAARLAR